MSALVLAIALPGNLVWAQEDNQSSTMMLYGVRFDTDGITITSGGAKKLSGNFYVIGYGDVGSGQNSASLEGAYIITKGKFGLGALLGANSDWETIAAEENPVNYLVLASGAILSYQVFDGLQVWTAYKRKIPLEESQHKAMNIFGVGLALSFGK